MRYVEIIKASLNMNKKGGLTSDLVSGMRGNVLGI
jgi:hypothetical protein